MRRHDCQLYKFVHDMAYLFNQTTIPLGKNYREDCWPWEWCNPDEEPRVYLDGRTRSARKALWEMLHGELYPGLEVYGTCGNRNCMNLAHYETRAKR